MQKLCTVTSHVTILPRAGALSGNGSHHNPCSDKALAKLSFRAFAVHTESGKLKRGCYTFTAMPYCDEYFKSSQGGPLEINFSVTSNAHIRPIATPPSKAQPVANNCPDPVPGHATVELSGSPNGWAYIQVDSFGNFFPGTTEKFRRDGMSAQQWDAAFLKNGIYFFFDSNAPLNLRHHISR